MSDVNDSNDAVGKRLLLDGVVKAMGLQPATIRVAGTTVAATPDRAGSGAVAGYQIGQRTVLWCDPAVATLLTELETSERAVSDALLREWAQELDYDIVGQAVMKTLSGPLQAQPVPDDLTFHRFDWSRPEDLELVSALIDASTEDDLDESEVAMDDLDDVAVGLLDSDGRLVAYASMRPFDYEDRLGDIGVLVHESGRRRGWGSAVVSALIEHALPAGWEPLYRCDPHTNPGSHHLSAKLGFEIAITLTMVRLIPAEK